MKSLFATLAAVAILGACATTQSTVDTRSNTATAEQRKDILKQLAQECATTQWPMFPCAEFVSAAKKAGDPDLVLVAEQFAAERDEIVELNRMPEIISELVDGLKKIEQPGGELTSFTDTLEACYTFEFTDSSLEDQLAFSKTFDACQAAEATVKALGEQGLEPEFVEHMGLVLGARYMQLTAARVRSMRGLLLEFRAMEGELIKRPQRLKLDDVNAAIDLAYCWHCQVE